MNPFPLASTLCLFSAIFSGTCAYIIWRRRRIFKKGGNIFVSRFFYTFIFGTVNMFLMALPGIVLKDGISVQILYMVAGIVTDLTAIYLAYIGLAIFFPEHKKLFSYFVIILTAFFVLITAMGIPGIVPAREIIMGPFSDWQGSNPDTIQNFLTMPTIFFLFLVFIIVFIIKGWLHEDAIIRRRSRYISIGMFLVVLGWSSSQLFSLLGMSPVIFLLVSSTGGSILACVGLFILLRGTLMQG